MIVLGRKGERVRIGVANTPSGEAVLELERFIEHPGQLAEPITFTDAHAEALEVAIRANRLEAEARNRAFVPAPAPAPAAAPTTTPTPDRKAKK